MTTLTIQPPSGVVDQVEIHGKPAGSVGVTGGAVLAVLAVIAVTRFGRTKNRVLVSISVAVQMLVLGVFIVATPSLGAGWLRGALAGIAFALPASILDRTLRSVLVIAAIGGATLGLCADVLVF